MTSTLRQGYVTSYTTNANRIHMKSFFFYPITWVRYCFLSQAKNSDFLIWYARKLLLMHSLKNSQLCTHILFDFLASKVSFSELIDCDSGETPHNNLNNSPRCACIASNIFFKRTTPVLCLVWTGNVGYVPLVVVCSGLTSLSTFFSHITTVSGCDKELNDHCAAVTPYGHARSWP